MKSFDEVEPSRINLFSLPIFPPSSHSIVVFFFPLGLLSLMRTVENVALTTKGLHERKTQLYEWDDGGKIGNENILILTEIFPSVHET